MIGESSDAMKSLGTMYERERKVFYNFQQNNSDYQNSVKLLNDLATALSTQDETFPLYWYFKGQFAYHLATFIVAHREKHSLSMEEATFTALPLLLVSLNLANVTTKHDLLDIELVEYFQIWSAKRAQDSINSIATCVNECIRKLNGILVNLKDICSDNVLLGSNADNVLEELWCVTTGVDWQKKLHELLYRGVTSIQTPFKSNNLLLDVKFKWPNDNDIKLLFEYAAKEIVIMIPSTDEENSMESNNEVFEKTNCTEYQSMSEEYNVESKHQVVEASDSDIPLLPAIPEKMFKCDVCGLTSDYLWNLQRHQLGCHTNLVTKFKCTECGASFSTKGNLKKHFVSKHSALPFVEPNGKKYRRA